MHCCTITHYILTLTNLYIYTHTLAHTHTHTHMLWGYTCLFTTLQLVEVNPLCEDMFPGVSGMRQKLKFLGASTEAHAISCTDPSYLH